MMESATPSPKRTGKANWPDAECLYLMQLYKDYVHVLQEDFIKPGVSNRAKQGIWENIAHAVNERYNRTKKEVMKRCFTISSKSRQRLQKHKQCHDGTGK